MKNAETTMAAFYNCCLVEDNNLFAKTLFFILFQNLFIFLRVLFFYILKRKREVLLRRLCTKG